MTSNTKENAKSSGYSNNEESESNGQRKSDTDFQVEEEQANRVDENLSTLQKIHAILLNCLNLTKKQKLEYAESERFFMKLHLKKLIDKLKDS